MKKNGADRHDLIHVETIIHESGISGMVAGLSSFRNKGI